MEIQPSYSQVFRGPYTAHKPRIMLLQNHHPAYHRRYGCQCRARVPLHHARAASLVSPTVHFHPPAPRTTPVLAQCSLVLYTARASNGFGFGFEYRRGRLCGWPGCGSTQNRAVSIVADVFIVSGVGLRGMLEVRAKRGVVVRVCEPQSIPRPSGSGAVHRARMEVRV
jgi:hypothetical protein